MLNFILGIPDWLPTVLPSLKSLDLSGNPLPSLPPFLPLFRQMVTLTFSARPASNSLRLIRQAVEALEAQKQLDPGKKQLSNAENLTSICLRVLDTSLWQDLPDHLHGHLQESYICSSCLHRFLRKDPDYLCQPLVETIFLFNPPLMGESEQTEINKNSYIIGDRDWRFCAKCLCKHLSTFGCQCMVCVEEQRIIKVNSGVRWARKKSQSSELAIPV